MKGTVELSSGRTMPRLGLGTWKSLDDAVYRAVAHAIRIGYRHIDCAWIYGNEEQVGRAIRSSIDEGVVKRSELFVTSKLWNSFHEPEVVSSALDQTLEALGLEYLDLYLVHWPMAFCQGVEFPRGPEDQLSLHDVPLAATWAALEEAQASGRVRDLGVSNFGPRRLAEFVAGVPTPPVVNQVELHPYNSWPELVERAAALGVHLTAYSPLGSDGQPALLADPIVVAVAAEIGCTPAQALIAWGLARDTSVIPKSTNPSRLQENLEAASIELPLAARAAIDGIETRHRYIDPTALYLRGVNYQGSSYWD